MACLMHAMATRLPTLRAAFGDGEGWTAEADLVPSPSEVIVPAILWPSVIGRAHIQAAPPL